MEGEDRRARTPEPEPLARPSSPWHYQLKRRDANSPARASLRALGSTGSGSAATARAANVVHAAARASYEGAMLAAVRRQMESLEEKVEKQLSRQAQDRGREAAVQRLEEKLQATETLQPKVERRLAELSGNFKGLSDEMQAQIRRVDLLDDRRWEWRHQVEEELAKKCQQQEQQVQLLAAGLKTQKGLEDEAAKLRVGVQLSGHKCTTASLLVACDGVASAVRRQKLEDELLYLGVCMINGLVDTCPFPACRAGNLQLVDGRARMFLKPFGAGAMWQLTFPAEPSEVDRLKTCPRLEWAEGLGAEGRGGGCLKIGRLKVERNKENRKALLMRRFHILSSASCLRSCFFVKAEALTRVGCLKGSQQ
ncbi:unnamed protein product [Effrenium voratum]|nr:unnamed protein product [Effrenium voratum]